MTTASPPAEPGDFVLNGFNYGKTKPDGQHERYPTDGRTGGPFVRPVFDSYVHDKCGAETVMGRDLAETYARNPKFYGATFCVGCGGHFPVGEHGEFTWAKDPLRRRVGT